VLPMETKEGSLFCFDSTIRKSVTDLRHMISKCGNRLIAVMSDPSVRKFMSFLKKKKCINCRLLCGAFNCG